MELQLFRLGLTGGTALTLGLAGASREGRTEIEKIGVLV